MVTNRVLTRMDPTRTATLRRAFAADMKQRYAAVRRALVELVVDDDAFGLSPRAPVTFHQVPKNAYAFATDARKVEFFRDWLKEQVDANLLTTVGGEAGKPWTARYVESSYRKGRMRAYVDSQKSGLLKKRVPGFGEVTREEFLRSTFLQPETLRKIELVATRAFEELRGVSAAMSQTLSRDLAEGLANGWHPQKVARKMTESLGKNFRTRAQLIARTETIRAHAEGQLDTFEQLGVERLGAQVEWATAGDPCEQCLTMEGRTFTVQEARGYIPLHPNCQCAWVPYVEPDKATLEGAAPVQALGPKAEPGLAALPKPKGASEYAKGTGGWVETRTYVPKLSDPNLPAWAQGAGAPNPTFASKAKALKSLSQYDDKVMLKSSFSGGVDIAKRKVLYKAIDIPIDKLYHSTQADMYVGGLRRYLSGNALEKARPIKVYYNERTGKFMIWDGHHRAEAARAIGRGTIKADVWSNVDVVSKAAKVLEPAVPVPVPPIKAVRALPKKPSVEAIKAPTGELLKLKTRYVGQVDEDYAAVFSRQFDKLTSKFPKVADRIREIDVLPKDKYVAKFGKNSIANAGRETDRVWRISFRKDFFGQDAKYDVVTSLKRYKQTKTLVSSKLEDTFTHEFGHLVFRSLPKIKQKKIADLFFDDMFTNGAATISRQVSKYASVSYNEMFAECFTQWFSGTPSALTKKVVKIAGLKK